MTLPTPKHTTTLRRSASTTRFVVPTLLSMALATVFGVSGMPNAFSQSAAGDGAGGTLKVKTSWIGNTFPGRDGWVQNNIASIYVSPDGTVYSNTIWDEGGREVTAYRDGRVVMSGDHTHGSGNAGGIAIAGNSRYLYTGAGIGSPGSGPTLGNFPQKGHFWYGVTRRPLRQLNTGAAFATGRGNRLSAMQNSFALISETTDQSGNVTGLAATESTLFVSDATDNKIIALDAETMAKQREWHVDSPGRIAVDPSDNSVWVITEAGKQWTGSNPPHVRRPRMMALAARQRTAGDGESGGVAPNATSPTPEVLGDPTVLHFTADGKPLPTIPSLADDVEPVDLHVDQQHRLLLADNGPAQQILVYGKGDDGKYEAMAPVGVKGGMLSAPAGQAGPLRFNGLTGVSTDAKGNLYVSMNGRGPDGAATLGSQLQSYAPSGNGWQKQNWQVQGLTFADVAVADPNDQTHVYTQSGRYEMDYDRPSGKEGRFDGITVDRFKYTDDPRLQAKHPFMTAMEVVRLGGKPFLALTDMYSSQLSVYRLGQDGGIIATPATVISRGHANNGAPPGQPAKGSGGKSGGWIWRDANGDGHFSADEYQSDPGNDRAGCAGWWIDEKGDVWAAMGPDGVRRYAYGGLDAHGAPIYRYDQVQNVAVPAPFTRIQRVRYDAAGDTLYVTGYTADKPADPKLWKEAGTVFARYDNWSKGNRKARFTIDLPWSPSAKPLVSTIAMSVAGDYLFTAESVTAKVHVFDLRSGKEEGTMGPGADVGNVSGWVDLTQGISATKRANGEYVVFVEEDARSKVMMYRWHP
ncbi:hypothetical protein JOE11_004046 [Robbsia andropogonis]|uniref:hypothetical protein n=1 Tax=Robbsia andropogonis TaxID=28092 RepID=UPI003D1CB3B8